MANSNLPSDIAVRVEDLSKKFRPQLDLPSGRRRQKLHLMLMLLGLKRESVDSHSQPSGANDGTALDGVSASFKRGTVTGIAGKSGSGKSVLLKIIGGVTMPSSGTVRIRGKLIKLLNIDDLDEDLTAQQFLRDDIDTKKVSRADRLEQMLEFSGLLDFSDVSINKYSTGMRLRLAMASVLCEDADVILIDNYTGVGDLEFQQKCHKKIRELITEGAAVIIASNDTQLLEKLCDHILWLEGGKVLDQDRPDRTLPEMLLDLPQRATVTNITSLESFAEKSCFRLVQASVTDLLTGGTAGFSGATPLRFHLTIEALFDIDRVRLAITLWNNTKPVLRSVLRDHIYLRQGERLDADMLLPSYILAPGIHEVEIIVDPEWAGEQAHLKLQSALRFEVNSTAETVLPRAELSRAEDIAVTNPEMKWTCSSD